MNITEPELKNMIRRIVEEIGTEITLTTSSVKLSTGAKGTTTWEVKVYNPDPVDGANLANYLNAKLKMEHTGETYVPPNRIEHPAFSTPTPKNQTSETDADSVPSPASLRRKSEPDASEPESPFPEDDPDFD